MNTGRSYRLGARADSMRETRERILESARTAVLTKYYDEYTLQEIASEASVTVQTVLRHFGSKEGLLSAVKDHFASVITSRMDTVPVGDVREAITVLYDRYEWMGDGNCRLMAQEERVEPIADWVRDARAIHRAWVERTFAPYLLGTDPEREVRLLQLLVLCDVYTWKLLRRDQGCDRDTAIRVVLELIEPLIHGTKKGDAP